MAKQVRNCHYRDDGSHLARKATVWFDDDGNCINAIAGADSLHYLDRMIFDHASATQPPTDLGAGDWLYSERGLIINQAVAQLWRAWVATNIESYPFVDFSKVSFMASDSGGNYDEDADRDWVFDMYGFNFLDGQSDPVNNSWDTAGSLIIRNVGSGYLYPIVMRGSAGGLRIADLTAGAQLLTVHSCGPGMVVSWGTGWPCRPLNAGGELFRCMVPGATLSVGNEAGDMLVCLTYPSDLVAQAVAGSIPEERLVLARDPQTGQPVTFGLNGEKTGQATLSGLVAGQLLFGAECKLYRNTGTYEDPAWVPIMGIKDVSLPLGKTEVDATTRKAGKWKAVLGALREASVEFDIVWDTADEGFLALLGGYVSDGPVELAVMAGDLETEGSQGLRATMTVLTFDRTEPLDNIVMAHVVVKPTLADHEPEWLVIGA